ncbi:MAG: alpha/beta hydrolase [Chloroflexota bacterium]|nr:alpha/beta hydrolase [Chloroflexota bacterium]
MALNLTLDFPIELSVARELTFAGDEVRLAGQIDYPVTSRTPNGFPLLFILHHAGCNTREDYRHIAEAALESDYAVFRWDKRGTGRSGGGARGSSVQDAVNAYTTALEQPGINRKHIIIAAFGAGTALLGSAFGLFARTQLPCGVLLVANMLDAEAVLAIDAPLQIIASDEAHFPAHEYAEAVCAAHNKAYKQHGAAYHIAHDVDQVLKYADGNPDLDARDAIRAWLERV